MSSRPVGWLTADYSGHPGMIMRQYVDTVLLRLRVKLYLRTWRRTKRRFLTGWMSR